MKKLLPGLAGGVLGALLFSSLPAVAALAEEALTSISITSASGLSGAGTVDSPLAFTGTTTAAISTSAAAPQYACSLATATCQTNSATNDATTSATVGAFTWKPTVNVTDGDVIYDFQNSAAAHLLTINEQGKGTFLDDLQVTGGEIYFGGVENGSYLSATSTVLYLGAGNNWHLAVDSASGNVEVRSTDYLRIAKTFAGAATATDCDAAGEAGRLTIDTTNNRLYYCNGAAWQYVNEDVP